MNFKIYRCVNWVHIIAIITKVITTNEVTIFFKVKAESDNFNLLIDFYPRLIIAIHS